MPNEQEQFLKDIEQNVEDPFAYLNETPQQVEETPKPKEDEDDEEGDEFKPRNRRERRLAKQLQAEKESNIQLSTKLSEREAITKATESEDYLKNIERIYGTESPEAREATEILKQALLTVKEAAKNEALNEYKSDRNKESEAQRRKAEELEELIEEVEDEYNIDLQSSAERKGFVKLLEKMSPKDRATGEILHYADPIAVWETYQSRKRENPAKNLASRSMVQSQSADKSNLQTDTLERQLKEYGII